jgi:pantothenate kinase
MNLPWRDAELEQRLEVVRAQRERLIAAHAQTPRITLEAAARLALAQSQAAQGRIIVGLGGCPASGKTTAAGELTRLINVQRPGVAANLPMDGYHFTNAKLERLGLERIKGDRQTYEVAAFRDKLAEFKRRPGVRLTAPDYVRRIHEVVEDAIAIEAECQVLVTEGIYVGFPREDWAGIRSALDLLFYIDTPPEECLARVAARNRAAGRDEALIRHKMRNDLGFMEASLEILGEADAVIGAI